MVHTFYLNETVLKRKGVRSACGELTGEGGQRTSFALAPEGPAGTRARDLLGTRWSARCGVKVTCSACETVLVLGCGEKEENPSRPRELG